MNQHEQTIQRVLHGDREAFAAIVQAFQKPIYCMVRNMLADAHEAEDVAQDVFLSAYRNLHRYDNRQCALSTWLFTIARNRCLNVLKRRRLPTMQERPSLEYMPQDPLAQAELRQQLDRALDALPADQKTAFVLSEFLDLSSEEVAAIEGVPPGTIRSRLSRAKSALRQRLKHLVGEYQ